MSQGIVLTEAEREALEYAIGALRCDSNECHGVVAIDLRNRAYAIESLLARAGATEGISDEL